MQEEIRNITNQALAQIMDAKHEAEIMEIKTSYLGRKGKVNSFILKMKTLPHDENKQT